MYQLVHQACTIWYMPAPVTVSITVPQPVDEVFAFLDVMANHEPFTDHLMQDWTYSGPATGVGARARVHTRAMGVSDVVDIEVVDAEAPTRIVERNTAHKAGRVGQGTYTLAPRADGGTEVHFEYRWIKAPLMDRILAPAARSFIRKANSNAMERLAGRLAERAEADRSGPDLSGDRV